MQTLRVTNDSRFSSPNDAVCRYCRQPRPDGYSVTCGRSECQEAAFLDKEKRKPSKR